MGYYTESHFKFTLRADTPKKVIDVLDGTINNRMEFYAKLLPEGNSIREHIEESIKTESAVLLSVADTPNLPIEHAFGKCHRWDQFLSGSFDVRTHIVKIDSNIKNYDQEITKFLGWLSPYIVRSRKIKGTYLGWSKGEDTTSQIHYHLEQFLDPNSFINKYFMD